jgi:glycerophosphoryl diester phosphodiesterase
VTLFHRFNRFAFGWDMQQDHVLDDGIRMGLDGVFSDYTDRMIDAFARNV